MQGRSRFAVRVMLGSCGGRRSLVGPRQAAPAVYFYVALLGDVAVVAVAGGTLGARSSGRGGGPLPASALLRPGDEGPLGSERGGSAPPESAPSPQLGRVQVDWQGAVSSVAPEGFGTRGLAAGAVAPGTPNAAETPIAASATPSGASFTYMRREMTPSASVAPSAAAVGAARTVIGHAVDASASVAAVKIAGAAAADASIPLVIPHAGSMPHFKGQFVQSEMGLANVLSPQLSLSPPNEVPPQPPNVHGAPTPDNLQLRQDGVVAVKDPASESVQIQNEEALAECLEKDDLAGCMAYYGSYGVRHIYTDSFDDIIKSAWDRPSWMANEHVQKRRLFELTLPMARAAGAYEVEGMTIDSAEGAATTAFAQHYSVYNQLRLGVRAIELPVALDGFGVLHTANGLLTESLKTVLLDVRRFLSTNPREIVIILARVADLWTSSGVSATVEPLRAEARDPAKIPGEGVHLEVERALGEWLATHRRLLRLGSDEAGENARVGELVRISARAFYFWEGQQVLCTSRAACMQTPGWHPPDDIYPLPFGAPMPRGIRQLQSPGARVLEPGCVAPSNKYTRSWMPDQLVTNLKTYNINPEAIKKSPPLCAMSGELPERHTPTMFHELDAFVTLTDNMQGRAQQMLQGRKEVYTLGEAYNAKTNGERTNYLLLTRFLRNNTRRVFTMPNLIATDFTPPVVVHRIVEAMQEKPECGIAIHCKDSGSCFAMSRLAAGGQCLLEEECLDFLKKKAGTPVETIFSLMA